MEQVDVIKDQRHCRNLEEKIGILKSASDCSSEVGAMLRTIKSFMTNVMDSDPSQIELLVAGIMVEEGLTFADTHLKGACTNDLNVTIEMLEGGCSMTKDEVSKALVDVTSKLDLLQAAAKHNSEEGSDLNSETVERLYTFAAGADVILKEAVITLCDIENANA